MELQTKDFYTLDQYEVKLTKIDDRLLIEIEDLLIAKSFSIELTSPVVSQATNDIFSDVNTMCQGLHDALLKTHPEVSLYFDGYGGLVYQVSFSVGVIKKEHKFTLDLIEKKLDPLLRLEKKMENKFARILNKVSEIEKQIKPEGELAPETSQTGKDEIIKMIERLEGRIFEKLDNMEERITALEGQKTGNSSSDIDVNKILTALSRLEIPKETRAAPEKTCKPVTQDYKVLFDSSSSKASGFAFLNGNRTVEFIDPNAHFEIPFNKELPKTGKIVLSVKLEVIPNSIWIGIISEEHVSKACWYEFDINYLTAGGIVFNNAVATMPAKEAGFGAAGDVVSMVIDVDEGLIVFQVNGSEVNSIKVDLQGKIYIPYCGAFEKGCKITVI